MGFFQDLFGDTQAGLARDSRNELYGTRGLALSALSDNYGAAKNDITSGYGTARDAISTGYGQAVNAINPNFDSAIKSLYGGANQGQNYLSQGRDAAIGAYSPLSDLSSKYGGATSLALGALGVNGQEGINNARSAFQPSLGYTFNLDQGLEAINRARASSGQLASGNTDRSAQTYGAGLASQEYNSWVNSLLGFTSPELSATGGAASGIAGANQNYGQSAATLEANTGQSISALQQSRGSMLADLASKYGTNIGTSYTNQADKLAGINSTLGTNNANIYQNFAQPIAGTYAGEAAARGTGAANVANLGLSLAQLGTGFAGGLSGGLSGGGLPAQTAYNDPTRLGTLY